MKYFLIKLSIFFVILVVFIQTTPVNASYFTLPVKIASTSAITAYFDHDGSFNGSMTRFTGDIYTDAQSAVSTCHLYNSGFGCYDDHNGTDFDGDFGDNILSPYDGEVKNVYWHNLNGWTMHLWHPAIGLSTLYTHIATTTLATTSDSVQRYEHIAEMDSTGASTTGAHLHFGVVDTEDLSGDRLDPFGWSGTNPDPWPHNQGYLWTTSPLSFDVPTTWYDTDWDYRVKITVDHTKVSEDLKAFPVYVDLTDLPGGFHSNVRSDGGDIRVTKSDGETEIPREVVSYNLSADSGELHLKSGLLSSNVDSSFYIYYGNPSATDYTATSTYGRNAVWDKYLLVMHGDDFTDSTGKRSFTNVNSVSTSTGKVGGTLAFDGSNYIYTPDADDLDLVDSDLSISTWLRLRDVSAYRWEYIILSKNGFYDNTAYNFFIRGLEDSPNLRKPTFNNGTQNIVLATNPVTLDAWEYLTLSYDSAIPDAVHFKNSVINGTSNNVHTSVGNSQPLRIGNQPISAFNLTGDIDEIRLKSSETSLAWSSAEHLNMASSTEFYSVGTQEVE